MAMTSLPAWMQAAKDTAHDIAMSDVEVTLKPKTEAGLFNPGAPAETAKLSDAVSTVKSNFKSGKDGAVELHGDLGGAHQSLGTFHEHHSKNGSIPDSFTPTVETHYNAQGPRIKNAQKALDVLQNSELAVSERLLAMQAEASTLDLALTAAKSGNAAGLQSLGLASADGAVKIKIGGTEHHIGDVASNVFTPKADVIETAAQAVKEQHTTASAKMGETAKTLREGASTAQAKLVEADQRLQDVGNNILKKKDVPASFLGTNASGSAIAAVGTKGRIAGGTAAFEQLGYTKAFTTRVNANWQQSGMVEKGVRGAVGLGALYVAVPNAVEAIKGLGGGSKTDEQGNVVPITGADVVVSATKATAALVALGASLAYGGKNRATHGQWSVGG